MRVALGRLDADEHQRAEVVGQRATRSGAAASPAADPCSTRACAGAEQRHQLPQLQRRREAVRHDRDGRHRGHGPLRARQDHLQARHRQPVAARRDTRAATAPAAPTPARLARRSASCLARGGAPAPRRPAGGDASTDERRAARPCGHASPSDASPSLTAKAASCRRARRRRRSARRRLPSKVSSGPDASERRAATPSAAPTASLGSLRRAQPRHVLRADAEHARHQHRVIVDQPMLPVGALEALELLLLDAGSFATCAIDRPICSRLR